MHAFRHSSAESRLCRLTIDELNKQRAAAGAVAAIPLNKRAAEANAAVQNQPTKNTGSAVTDPAAASMQRLRDTQAYLAENPSVDPTGSIGKQALEGQAMAETYVAPRNLGNEQYYKDQANFLQDYTATKSNAADGFASSIDQGVSEVKDPITGEIKYVRTQGNVQTASMSQIQQSAIGNLRKAGKTDEEIKATLDDPTYLQNIAQTMSNTGLGGTARQSAVLTPAQAQSVLATSRNPNERKAAQDALDAAATQGVSQTVEKQVGTDKNGNPIYMTQTNPNYEAEVEAKRQRMAQEQANKLKVQESEKKMKEFTAGVDTTALTETQKQISGIMESIKGLSPELQSAVLPNLLNLQQSNNEALNMAQQMINALPTDQEIESQYGTMEKYILSQSSKYEDLLKKNKDHQIEVAEYNKEALEIDKKILEHDAAVAEQKQAQANIENEKKLRRQLNKLGLNTDVQGLSFLNSEIQKGVDALENMKTANNLVSLKANLAISKGYSLEVKGILNDYEGKYLEITSKTTEALNSVRSSISKDKSERDKEMRSIMQKALDQKNENDKEARDMLFRATTSMIESRDKLAAQEKADIRADKRLEYQEKMANARLNASEDRADARAERQIVQDERADAKMVYADFKIAEDQPEVKNYVVLRDATSKAKKSFENAINKGGKIDLGVAKEMITVLYEKGLDPTSVVREGEYLRASLGQSWYDNAMLFAESVAGGDRTGITQESAQAFLTALEASSETQRASALSRMSQPLTRLMLFNQDSKHINIDPRAAATIQELIRPEDLAAFATDDAASYDYNYSSYNTSMKNSTYTEDSKVIDPLIDSMPESGMTMDQIYGSWDGLQLLSSPESVAVQSASGTVGEILSSMAPVTQNFSTPISSANYKPSTVTAWGGQHKGLDIAFAAGSFVPSMTEGVLESVEYSKDGWGLTAVVRAPDGAEIRYSHLASIDPMLKVGSQLVRGREIAQVGNTGNVFSTSGGDGTHLDFRIKKNGQYIDPFSYTV